MRYSPFNDHVLFGRVCKANNLPIVVLKSNLYIGLGTEEIGGLETAMKNSMLYTTQKSVVDSIPYRHVTVTSTAIELKHVLAALDLKIEEIETKECDIA